MTQQRVGILVFEEVEVLDVCGPFEVFAATRLDELDRRDSKGPYDVCLVAQRPGLVRASGGLRLVPDHGLEDCPRLDVLVVPGGWGTRTEVANATLLDWIALRASQARTVASVCTGSFLLGEAGLLDGLEATTHWQSIARLGERFPGVVVRGDRRWVDQGKILTSAGVAAGIDLALHIVARDHGEVVALATARHMEYPYSHSAEQVS